MFMNRIYQDRAEAGEFLGDALARYAGKDTLVLAIPRGGVEVGWLVARKLGAEFSLVVVRKLPFPHNPEAGFGAVAEDGSLYLVPGMAEHLPAGLLRTIVTEQKAEVERRVAELRGGEPLPSLAGRTVILVDDGLAMGSTMRAALALARKKGAARVVVAAPVAGDRSVAEFTHLADQVVVPLVLRPFRAVAEGYRDWWDVTDREVQEVMALARNRDPAWRTHAGERR